jgi:RNA polymerase sigma-70 factor (ECF subfamily)
MDTSSSGGPPISGSDEPSPHSPFEEDTASLLDRAQAGDGPALEQLCARFLPRLYRWATGRLPPYARSLIDTHDLVQEVMVKTTRRLGDFQNYNPGAFPAYLRTAILNRIRDEVRRAAVRPEFALLEETEATRSASPLDTIIGQELAERYEEAMMRLNEIERSAVFLRIEMDMTYELIADALNKPSAEAARLAVHRALLRLAEEIEL